MLEKGWSFMHWIAWNTISTKLRRYSLSKTRLYRVLEWQLMTFEGVENRSSTTWRKEITILLQIRSSMCFTLDTITPKKDWNRHSSDLSKNHFSAFSGKVTWTQLSSGILMLYRGKTFHVRSQEYMASNRFLTLSVAVRMKHDMEGTTILCRAHRALLCHLEQHQMKQTTDWKSHKYYRMVAILQAQTLSTSESKLGHEP